MLHRKRGEGEHPKKKVNIKRWTLIFLASTLLAYVFVLSSASAVAASAYALGQQPRYSAQALSLTHLPPDQSQNWRGLSRKIFAYSQSSIDELNSQLSDYPTHPFAEQIQSLNEQRERLSVLISNVDTLKQELETLRQKYEQLVQNENAKRSLYEQAQRDQISAQNYYTLALNNYNDPATYIPDPTWERPLIEVQTPYEVEYTVLVPYTETVEVVTLVPREVTTVYQGTLTASVYNYLGYNSSPPFPYQINRQPFYTTQVPNINFNWGGGQILNSGLYEDVLVKFEGNIILPTSTTYTFYMSADDGNTLTINNQELIYGWWDKGGGGPVSQPTQFTAGVYPLTSYFYENGGGAAVTLYYTTPETPYWQVVPTSWFGEYSVTETVYDEVITYEEVTNYVEEIRYRTEYEITYVPDVNAVHPTIPDPELYDIAQHLEVELHNATEKLGSSVIDLDRAQVTSSQQLELINLKEEDITTSQTKVEIAEAQLEQDASNLEQLIATYIEEQSVQPTPTPEPEPLIDLAAVPVLGEALSALSDVGEALANIGSDMSPEVREQAQKVVVSAIVVTQVATQAAQIATQAAQAAQAAAASASASASSSGSSSTGRRK